MANINTILSEVGHVFKVFFTDATKVAQIAEPIVDVAFPGISALYNLTVTAAANAENAAIAAGAQSGSGAQKLALVVASIESAYADYAKSAGITATPAAVIAWANAVVATLNAIPAASTSIATTATPVSGVITSSAL